MACCPPFISTLSKCNNNSTPLGSTMLKALKLQRFEAFCIRKPHLFVEIPPKMAASSFRGCLRGKSSSMIYEQFGELKYRYRNRSFWCKGYYVDTVGKNATTIFDYNSLGTSVVNIRKKYNNTEIYILTSDGMKV